MAEEPGQVVEVVVVPVVVVPPRPRLTWFAWCGLRRHTFGGVVEEHSSRDGDDDGMEVGLGGAWGSEGEGEGKGSGAEHRRGKRNGEIRHQVQLTWQRMAIVCLHLQVQEPAIISVCLHPS